MSKPNGEEHLIQIRYADTHEQKMLKQQTAAGRVFRAAEYEVGVAQARALGTPDRYDTVSTFLLKYLKLLLDFSAQILLDFSAQIFSNHFSNFLLKLFKSLLNLSIHVEGKSASRGGLALSGKQVAYFQPGPSTYISLAVLPPAGVHFGPSMFANGAAWVVSCHWPNEERARWQSIQAHRELQHAPPPPPSPPPYEDLYPSAEIEGVENDWESEIRASAPRAQFF